jgi:hypothetical protein
MMHKRFLAITFLAVGLLFSQTSNHLIASLCPHLRSGRAACEVQIAQPVAAHEHSGHVQTESVKTESTREHNTDEYALGQPTEPCKHCAIHSKSGRDAGSLTPTQGAKRIDHLKLPLLVHRILVVPTSFVITLIARSHGPPGYRAPGNILLNIFRI